MTDQTKSGSQLGAIPRSLFVFAIFYGGMVPLGGFLGAKQVAIGPLAVEAGIFPFLTLIAVSSAIAELHGREIADRLVRYGFVPLFIAIFHRNNLYQPKEGGLYYVITRGNGRQEIFGRALTEITAIRHARHGSLCWACHNRDRLRHKRSFLSAYGFLSQYSLLLTSISRVSPISCICRM